MKTKFLKFGMPLMAFLLAIVFAFATHDNATYSESSFVTGYVYNHDNSDCIPAQKDCALTGTIACTYDSKPVFRIKNGTQCQIQLFEWMH